MIQAQFDLEKLGAMEVGTDQKHILIRSSKTFKPRKEQGVHLCIFCCQVQSYNKAVWKNKNPAHSINDVVIGHIAEVLALEEYNIVEDEGD